MNIITSNIREEVLSYLHLSTTQPLLLNGDASFILQELPDQSIDMAMTSPPYWQKRQYSHGGIGLEIDYTDYIQNLCHIIWQAIVNEQVCPFLQRKCLNNRKSAPEQTIGTCTVSYGRDSKPIIICPYRLLERKQIFTDCLHLLTTHEPGNELHVVSEISIPGGNVDYFLLSVHDRKVKDFVGIELQTLDTTGTVWPFRQRYLASRNVDVFEEETASKKSFGMNWKMTAKTTLVQLHHKIETFEHVNKHLVLAIQCDLLEYMGRAFSFDHVTDARGGDAMHFHAYELTTTGGRDRLTLHTRKSTAADGIGICLGLQIQAKVELADLIQQLEAKISDETIFTL